MSFATLPCTSVRRKSQVHGTQAVKQVLAERAHANAVLKVAIGGGNDAHINFDLLGFLPDTHRLDDADAWPFLGQRLKRTQELRLICRSQFPHLVQEQSTTVGSLEGTTALLLRASEGTGQAAKQLALEQSFRNRGTVDRDERFAGIASWAGRMDGRGNRLPGVRGTLWAAFNGVTELLDHRKTRQSPHQRLSSLWFGDNYRTKARAFSLAQEKMEAWKN